MALNKQVRAGWGEEGWGEEGVLWDYHVYLVLELLALGALLVLTEVHSLLVLLLPLGQGGLVVLQAAALLLGAQKQHKAERRGGGECLTRGEPLILIMNEGTVQ